MTTRLYQLDSKLIEFNSQITQVRQHNGAMALLLDATAFYPSVGGQPNDTGTLGGAAVVDVIERDDGSILHVLAAPLALVVGDAVAGCIDWPRRFDHMQQHSGQHVLSAAFARTASLETTSVHISAGLDGICTLDLAQPATPAQLRVAEDDANQCIFDARACKVYEVSDADLASIPLRKAPKVSGRIRIVEFEGYDWSACGGTHVRHAGQIGVIRVLGGEKKGAGMRVNFCCGWRALHRARYTEGIATRLAGNFTIGLPELEAQVARLRDEHKRLSRELTEAQMQLMKHEAATLLAHGEKTGGQTLIVHIPSNRDAAYLRALAKTLAETPSVIALLGSITDKTALAFARHVDVAEVDLRPALKAALAVYDNALARGGGSADCVQGAAPSTQADLLAQALRVAQAGLHS